jgi:hypothetical protein
MWGRGMRRSCEGHTGWNVTDPKHNGHVCFHGVVDWSFLRVDNNRLQLKMSTFSHSYGWQLTGKILTVYGFN